MNFSVILKYLYIVLTVCLTFGIGPLIAATSPGRKNAPRATKGSFPKNFLWGTAISEYQLSGAFHCPASNWARWEAEKYAKRDTQQSGKAADFWERYRHDIPLMKRELGINSFRFSVEWSIIEPEEGVFNEKALQHYANICATLRANAIEPMITLHHFTHPQWFEEKGAFEKEENIAYFVRFCRRVFERLAPMVDLWCTINEPTIYAFQGYIRGVFPPGHTGVLSFVPTTKAVQVLKHLLQAHVEVYQTLKAMPHGRQAQIGLTHQYLEFKPYSWWNPLERIPGMMLNNFLNNAVLKFYQTGVFTYNFHILGITSIHEHYKAPSTPVMDFLGLNYYSRVLVTMRPGHPFSSCYPGEIMTDMPYAIHPEGFYKAIRHVASFGLPIYITETGIADAKDDRREFFIKEYLNALYQALHEGCDVRGFYYWSFIDNYEWDMGYVQQFGLYSFDPTTQKRTLKRGAHYYSTVVKHNALPSR